MGGAADSTSYQSFLLKLDVTYQLEKIDPYHRKTDVVHHLFRKYNQQRRRVGERAIALKSLFSKPELQAKFQAFLQTPAPSNHKQRVAYLDEQSAQQYQVKFVNGKVCDAAGNALDTTALKGKQKGFCAYVLDKHGKLFCAPHVKGALHHSSFTSGDNVLSSGMIKIKNGKVQVVNNNSGHYKPDNIHLSLLFYLLNTKDAFITEKDIYAGKSTFTKGVISLLMALHLYTPLPRMQLISRSPTLIKLGHRLQRYKPLYWLGRLLDASESRKEFNLRHYRKQAMTFYNKEYKYRQAIAVINQSNDIDSEKQETVLGKRVIPVSLFNQSQSKDQVEATQLEQGLAYKPCV